MELLESQLKHGRDRWDRWAGFWNASHCRHLRDWQVTQLYVCIHRAGYQKHVHAVIHNELHKNLGVSNPCTLKLPWISWEANLAQRAKKHHHSHHFRPTTDSNYRWNHPPLDHSSTLVQIHLVQPYTTLETIAPQHLSHFSYALHWSRKFAYILKTTIENLQLLFGEVRLSFQLVETFWPVTNRRHLKLIICFIYREGEEGGRKRCIISKITLMPVWQKKRTIVQHKGKRQVSEA